VFAEKEPGSARKRNCAPAGNGYKPRAMRPLLLLTALLIAAPVCPAAEESAPPPLRLQWQPGYRYTQRIQIEQTGKLPSKNGPKAQHANITAQEILTVRAHPKADWRYLGVSFGAFSITGANGDAKFSYNSAKPAGGVDEATINTGKAISAYLGREFLLQIDARGTISATEEFDTLLNEITKKAPHVQAPVKAFFSKTNITQMLKLGTLPAVPQEPVAAGGAWPFESKFEIPIVGSLRMNGTCTMKGHTKRGGAACCEIPIAGTLALISTPQASLMGLKSAEGKVSGAVWFDPNIGWARESVTTWDVTATLGGIASAQDGSAQFVPLKQTTRITLLSMEPVK
jgi:Family of unknown function (DUF6263)